MLQSRESERDDVTSRLQFQIQYIEREISIESQKQIQIGGQK